MLPAVSVTDKKDFGNKVSVPKQAELLYFTAHALQISVSDHLGWHAVILKHCVFFLFMSYLPSKSLNMP